MCRGGGEFGNGDIKSGLVSLEDEKLTSSGRPSNHQGKQKE